MSEQTTDRATYQGYAQYPNRQAQNATSEPSVGELISDLARDTQLLVRQEMALAKTEINNSVSNLISGLAKVAAGGFLIYAGLLVLLFAAVAGVHQADLSWWASAIIVGGVTLLVGLIVFMWARSNMRSASLMPTETVETLKEDRDWAKGQVR